MIASRLLAFDDMLQDREAFFTDYRHVAPSLANSELLHDPLVVLSLLQPIFRSLPKYFRLLQTLA